MNPNSAENQVNFEVPSQFPRPETDTNSAAEKGVVRSPENKPQSQSAQAQAQVANAFALPTQAVSNDLTDDVATAVTDDAQQIPDTDRIEKMWVDKAKAIVAKTREDPFEQKESMSRVKAEYIKKRFNKTIKIDDSLDKADSKSKVGQ